MQKNKELRMTALVKIEENTAVLKAALVQNNDVIMLLKTEEQESFKENFLSLAQNDYLLSMVSVKEIIKISVNITKIGLNINPIFKEVYIVPFNTKVGGNKVMLPQAIIPLNGIQEMAHVSGFFLHIHSVYDVEGEIVAENEMSRKQQRSLNTSNNDWVMKNFTGFDVVLTDISGNIPEQKRFVEAAYVKEVTKTTKDLRFVIQTWRHKAARRAFGDFLIPRDRRLLQYDKIEELNDNIIDVQPTITMTDDSLKQFGLSVKTVDNTLILEGNTYGKIDSIKQMGFSLLNNQWVKTLPETTIEPVIEISPAKQLYIQLIENGLNKDDVGHFVTNVLGVSKTDDKEIENILNDKDQLLNLVLEYKKEILSTDEIRVQSSQEVA